MPKYTSPVSLGSTTLIRSSTWNDYFGSKGNLQWAYSELENISGGRFVMMKKSPIVTVAVANTFTYFSNYAEAYGETDYANMTMGTIQSPVHTGYVWVSASIDHTIGTYSTTSYVPNLILSITDTSYTTSFVSRASTMYTSQGYTNTGAPANGTNVLAPMVRTLSVSALVPVSNGAKRFRVGINRVDAGITAGQIVVNHFTVIPLGDVSGLANFINNVEQVIE